MADQNRDQQSNQRNRGQQKSSPGQQDPRRRDRDTQRTQGDRASESTSWRDDESEDTRASERSRTSREPSSVAHDRSRDIDTQRRSFSQNRESDELGSELERETGIDESDEEDMGGPGRSDR